MLIDFNIWIVFLGDEEIRKVMNKNRIYENSKSLNEESPNLLVSFSILFFYILKTFSCFYKRRKLKVSFDWLSVCNFVVSLFYIFYLGTLSKKVFQNLIFLNKVKKLYHLFKYFLKKFS